MIDEITDQRAYVHSMLDGKAQYIQLSEKSKLPPRNHTWKSRNSKWRLEKPPTNGDYGIIPNDNLIVLDIDYDDKAAPVEAQKKFFGKVFGIDLDDTLAIKTPGKGYHYYFFSPTSIEEKKTQIPRGNMRTKIGSFLLENYDNPDNIEKLTCDLRSNQQNGLVVGPGSSTNSYTIVNNNPILTIPKKAMKKLVKLSKTFYNDPASGGRIDSTRSKPKKGGLYFMNLNTRDLGANLANDSFQGIDKLFLNNSHSKVRLPKNIVGVPRDKINRLRSTLGSKGNIPYHQKRAIVKTSLSCCYDDYSVTVACVDLGIDRDTYTNSKLSFKQTYNDVSSFNPVVNHGGFYCKNKFKTIIGSDEEGFEFRWKPYLTDHKIKGARNYRVLREELILEKLRSFSSRTKDSMAVVDAYNIVEHFLQPLSNMGAPRIVLSRRKLRTYFRWSDSRVSSAMILLRKAGVLHIVRRSSPGRSTLYTVPSIWNDKFLTRILGRTWASHDLADGSGHGSLIFDYRNRVFRDALTFKELFPVNRSKKRLSIRPVPSRAVSSKYGSICESYLYWESQSRRLPDGGFVPVISKGEVLVERQSAMSNTVGASIGEDNLMVEVDYDPLVKSFVNLSTGVIVENYEKRVRFRPPDIALSC